MKSKRFSRFWSAVSAAVVWLLVASSVPARAQFGGSQIVFDPNMFARQLQQLQQETATVTNLAQQLQYAIKNTTGGGAGVWQSNQNLLTNLGDLINRAGRTLVHLSGTDAAVPAALSGLQRCLDRRRPESANDGRYHAGHAQRRARFSAGAGPELPSRTGHPSKP